MSTQLTPSVPQLNFTLDTHFSPFALFRPTLVSYTSAGQSQIYTLAFSPVAEYAPALLTPNHLQSRLFLGQFGPSTPLNQPVAYPPTFTASCSYRTSPDSKITYRGLVGRKTSFENTLVFNYIPADDPLKRCKQQCHHPLEGPSCLRRLLQEATDGRDSTLTIRYRAMTVLILPLTPPETTTLPKQLPSHDPVRIPRTLLQVPLIP
jgi:hypothetical protein